MYWRFAPGARRAGPVRPVRQPQSFCDVGDDGGPALRRISRRARGGSPARHAPPGGAARCSRRSDGRTWMLAAASMLLVIATAASLSRSGIAGMTAAALCAVTLVRRRTAVQGDRAGRASTPLTVVAVGATLGALTLVGAGAIAGALRREPGRGSRSARNLARYATRRAGLLADRDRRRDVPGRDGGLSAQQAEVIFNQAHNHYLQIAAEGGVLVAVPACLALAVFAAVRAGQPSSRIARRCTSSGPAPLSGLVGVALQSLWETGLTIPANAALAAVLAAILLHGRRTAAAPAR